jgi:flavin reductase (DIM6/NTAB) family NADH-FMN oxidoreductase RutF
MIERQNVSDLAAALGRIPSGIFIVTCCKEGVDSAFLASWVQQCSFEPPMLTLAVRKGRPIGEWLQEKTPFCLHILAEGQKDLLGHFGKGLPLNQLPCFSERVQRAANLTPVIPEALAILHCTPTSVCDSGDHHLIVARIDDGSLRREDRPMIHVRKNGLNY